MKKLFVIACTVVFFSCNPSNHNPGESGAVDDGIKPIDENGALQDTGYQYTPQTDTAKGEHNVNAQPRN